MSRDSTDPLKPAYVYEYYTLCCVRAVEDTWFQEGGLQLLPLPSCYVIVRAYHCVLGRAHTRGQGNPPLQRRPINSCHIKVGMSSTHYYIAADCTANTWFTLCIVFKQGLCITNRWAWLWKINSCAERTQYFCVQSWENGRINLYTYCESLDNLCKEMRIYA